MQNVAQSWLVWHVSRSPVAIGVVAFFDTLPRLLVGAVGGAIADRFDRRRVLMITQALAMIQAIIYWLLVEFDVIQLWHIAALAFFLGVVNTINQTARQSLVNSLVPRDELLNAIGLQSSVFNFSKILGPSVGGVIIAYVGIAGCFLVNAISFIYLLFNLYQMDLPPWEKRSDEQSMWADVKEGFNYLTGNRRLLYIVGLSYVVATFVAPYNRFVPIFATNVLHVGASGFGLLMSAPGVGATVAALVLASVNKLRVGVRSICACATRLRVVDWLVCFFAPVSVVVCVLGDGRVLPDRRTGAFQHRDSNLDAGQFAGTGVESILYGSRLVVVGQHADRRLGRRHRHGLDFRLVRRDLRHNRRRSDEYQPQVSRRDRSARYRTNLEDGSSV